jgi:hypothetical protein
MIMAPSAFYFCFSLRAMARLRIARRTSAEIPAAQVPNVPYRTRELDCSELLAVEQLGDPSRARPAVQ